MKQLFLALSVACLIGAATAGAARAESKTGAAKFTPAGRESIPIAMGNQVKLNAILKVIQVGPNSAVSVSGKVQNNAAVKMNYAYFIAFLDKDKNLIGCHHFTLFVDAGKQGGAGTFIQLPPDEIARIAFYSVAFYESEKAIGSK